MIPGRPNTRMNSTVEPLTSIAGATLGPVGVASPVQHDRRQE